MSEIIKNVKALWKPFVLFFVLSFLLLNLQSTGIVWQKALVVSNYRFLLAKAEQVLQAGSQSRPLAFLFSNNFIKIPKLGLKAPIAFAQNNDLETLRQALQEGVLYYPSSVLPNEQGDIIILGHSAPLLWPEVNYDKVFNGLNTLEKGDKIKLFFNGWSYLYQVEEKFFVEGGEEIMPTNQTKDSFLFLISCWPLGSREKRIIIKAIKI